MKLPKDQPFWASVILHLVVLLGLFLATIVQAFKPKEKPHVFEMVEPPSQMTASQEPSPSMPTMEMPTVDLQPVPQVEIPQPAPPQPAPPKPAPTPTPAPKAEPKLMSADEFFKNHPKADPKPRTTSQTKQTVSVPKIEVPRIVIPKNPSPSAPQITSQQMSELQKYSSRLRAKIDAAWAKPEQLAGVRLEADVVFDVSASGKISNVRLKPSSGNAAFDQSVLAAFRRAASAGPTPTGQSHQFRLAFRMAD